MNKKENTGLVPKLRFLEFNSEEAWIRSKIRKYLKESKVKGNTGDTAKRLTVKLWGNGVFEKKDTLRGSENTQYYRRKSGQFIYSKLDFLNQAFGIIPEHLDNYESTVDLPCFDIDKDLDSKFLLEYVQRKSFYNKYGKIADGGRKAKRIQIETFLEFPIYLPKLPEQQKIANCLTSLDELITAESRKLEILKKHKKGLMQKLFPAEGKAVPEIRFIGYSDAWERRKLEDGTHKIGDGIHGTPIYEDNGKIAFINGNNLVNGQINITSQTKFVSESQITANDRSLNDDTILMSINGTIGNLAWYKGENIMLGKSAAYLEVDSFDKAFMYILLQTDSVKKHFLDNLTGATIKNLGLKTIRETPVTIPSPPEQNVIGEFFRNLDELITAQAEKIEVLKLHKKGLMQGLFPSTQEVIE
ncbi:MAG: restriction endonuclease subunit S [Prevotellaceae bacterium]|jgi:type I restriction enzyme S subunit|nr:restriction endonuclease subunit S [Prevotellaceae bacterium]